MRKFMFSLVMLCASLIGHADPLGETARYVLSNDDDRTSWLINEGEGVAKVSECRDDERIGPAYVISINYDLDVMFYGNLKGEIGLLVPAAMFEEQFYENLKNTHPVDVGSFDVDYLGMARANDNENNAYDQCLMIRIFNVDPNYRPITSPSVAILWHNSIGTLASIENLELNMKTHATVPVLGAVQIDMAGTVHGIDVTAGFDFVP